MIKYEQKVLMEQHTQSLYSRRCSESCRLCCAGEIVSGDTRSQESWSSSVSIEQEVNLAATHASININLASTS